MQIPRAIALLLALGLLGCSGLMGEEAATQPLPPIGPDAGPISTPMKLDGAPAPSADAFYVNDPPPKYCGPDGGWTAPPLPGGTPECPSDKNLQGCPCTKKGATAACWPGLRKNRNRGICKDGVTTCEFYGETQLRWGACQGHVLPTVGATKGAEACTCFSKGQWEIKNSAPCFVNYPNGQTYAVSTFVDSSGKATCPKNLSATPPPKPEAGQVWSANTLTVDCTGQFKLCYTIKAGDATKPAATDCVLAQSCTDAWYATKGAPQDLPPLPGWSSNDPACADTFDKLGGYGEMSVTGISVECEPIDDNGKPLVFHRITYCPLKCNTQPTLPECVSCGNGASGGF